MAGSRAALRIGLIGGLVLSLAVVAQQVTDSSDLQCFGFIITVLGLCVIGYLASREVGDPNRLPALRAGAVGGLIAGLLASMATVAVLIFLSVSGDTLQRAQAVFREMPPSLMEQYAAAGITIESLAQLTVTIQILCCPAVLPIMGLVFGTIGGAFASLAKRGQGQESDSGKGS